MLLVGFGRRRWHLCVGGWVGSKGAVGFAGLGLQS